MAARTSPTRASLAVLLTLGTGTGAFTAVSSTVDGPTDRRTESSAVAARPAPSGPDAPTSAGAEAPAVPFDAEAPAPITLTALPDETEQGDDRRSRGQIEAGPTPRKPDRPEPAPLTTTLLPSAAPTPEIGDPTTEPTPATETGQAAEPGQALAPTPQPTLTRTETPEGGAWVGSPVTREPSPSTADGEPSPSPTPESPEGAWVAPADTTPPETSLAEDHSERGTVVFSFSADEAATFSCSIDGGAWTSCASPTTYSDLGAGWHVFAVYATDEAGNVDATPAETSWQVKGGGPKER
ncbi:MAG TPA: hypothetical protein VGD51_06155 [Nocardioidaceae bacterium]